MPISLTSLNPSKKTPRPLDHTRLIPQPLIRNTNHLLINTTPSSAYQSRKEVANKRNGVVCTLTEKGIFSLPCYLAVAMQSAGSLLWTHPRLVREECDLWQPSSACLCPTTCPNPFNPDPRDRPRARQPFFLVPKPTVSITPQFPIHSRQEFVFGSWIGQGFLRNSDELNN